MEDCWSVIIGWIINVRDLRSLLCVSKYMFEYKKAYIKYNQFFIRTSE